MTSLLVKWCCKAPCPLLRQSTGLTRSSILLSGTLRQISSTSSASAAQSFSRVNFNFTQDKHVRIQEWQKQKAQTNREGVWTDIMQPMQPKATGGGYSGPADELWFGRHERGYNTVTAPNNAYTGRSLPVLNDDQGNGVADAWAKLSARLKRNNVYAEFKSSMRHEKKGVKRRRLESERWRRRFAHEVRQKVQLVKAIRRRGA